MKKSFFRNTSKSAGNITEEEEQELQQLLDAAELIVKAGSAVPVSTAERISLLKAKKSPNKINARKFIYKDIEYDSVREARFAKTLGEAGLHYEYNYTIVLQEGFKLENETIRPIEMRVDFYIEDEWLVDVKGHIMDVFKLKWKMLKFKFRDTKKYFIIQKDSDMSSFVNMVKLKRWKGL